MVEHLRIFLATRPEQVPAGCVSFISVDGSIPGAAVTWDHHVSGEPINLDAMPGRIDASDMDGVGTTQADTDAVASVVVVLLGGKERVEASALEVLTSASYRCDHLVPHPSMSQDINERGRGLHGFVNGELGRARSHTEREKAFAKVCRRLANTIASGVALPFDTSLYDAQERAVDALQAAGRVRDEGDVALVDLRGRAEVSPEALYTRLRSPVAVLVKDHEAGGIGYTVGVNPAVPSVRSLRGALERLAKAEHAHGHPAREPRPGPGSENWGGRETVGGSPWNYGSRLSPDEVVGIVREVLRGGNLPR